MVREGVVDIVFWTVVRLLVLSLTASFWTSCPAVDEQVRGVLGEELTERLGARGLRLAGDQSPAVFLRAQW